MTTATLFDFEEYPCLNIGGGNFSQRYEGWLNLDFPFDSMAYKRDFSNIDIPHNLMSNDPLPIPDNSLRAVYTEHALEHIDLCSAKRLFAQVHRILKPGGVFRISVPDADKCWKILIDENAVNEEFPSVWRPKSAPNSKAQSFLDATCTPLRGVLSDEELRAIIEGKTMVEALDNLYDRVDIDQTLQAKKPGHHISWWNFEKLNYWLHTYNFIDIHGPLERRESYSKLFRKEYLDRTAYKWSVRAEARKGG